MSNHSIIEHRANYHFIKVEEDYVHICGNNGQYPQCKAVILSILEHWINDKRAKGLDEYVYMTYPEWIDNMYGLFRRSTIIACLTELEQEQLISRRAVKRYGKITYEYTLNVQVVQERLKQLSERTEKYCRPNLNASKFKRVQKQTDVNLDGNTDVNLNGSEHEDAFKSKRNIDSITDIPSSIDSGGSDPINLEMKRVEKRETKPRIPIALSVSHSQRLSETNAEEEEDEPTVKMPITRPDQAVAKGTTDAGQSIMGHSDRGHDGLTDIHSIQTVSAQIVSSHSQRLSEKSDGEEEDEVPPVKVPAIKIGGNVDATDNIQPRSNTRTLLPHLPSHTRQVLASEHSPGTGKRSLAVTPKGGGQDDSTSDQASLDLASETPVQRSGIPPGNSPASPDAAQGGNSPPMAMTARDIKKQAEKRAKELWTIIEDELHTTFTENQRKSHKDGIASLIADDLSDEAIRTGLQALNTFERRTFTVSKFYGWLPNLQAKAPIFLKKASNGYQRDMVEWQGRYMTVEEADTLGFNGGFGEYL